MEGERDRIEGTGDHGRARARRLERGRQRGAARALAVQPDRQVARLTEPLDELPRLRRIERPRWIVDEDARGPELAEAVGALEENVRLTAQARAVHQAHRELLAGRANRLRGLLQVGQVVQRVVDPEDVDAACGGTRDEPRDEVARERARPDEQPAPQGHPERRLAACTDSADPLPRALHATADGRVEAASARHLEVRETGVVEDVRQLEHPGRLHLLGERLLREEPDAGVDESGHAYAREM